MVPWIFNLGRYPRGLIVTNYLINYQRINYIYYMEKIFEIIVKDKVGNILTVGQINIDNVVASWKDLSLEN